MKLGGKLKIGDSVISIVWMITIRPSFLELTGEKLSESEKAESQRYIPLQVCCGVTSVDTP